MNNIIRFVLIIAITSSCSLDTKSGFWTQNEISSTEINQKDNQILFKKKGNLAIEINPELSINIKQQLIENKKTINKFNNLSRVNFDSTLKKFSKFNFSRIKNFNKVETEIIFHKNEVIFFDGLGSILKFDINSNLIWKKNIYDKKEKKLKPILSFSHNNKQLIVADNILKYYALDINSGELLWEKYFNKGFNSQIKIHENKFFIVDRDNVLRAYSILDGSEIWNIKNENSFIKSQKKLSIEVLNNIVYFNSSTGDLNAVDIDTGQLLWQTYTQQSSILENTFSLKTSSIIIFDDSIFFSNNRNTFYSLDIQNGYVNWTQKINSYLKPIVIDNLVFSISLSGFMIILDKNNGEIIRSTDIFSGFKSKKRDKIKPVGFVMGLKNLYLTTDNGRLLTVDIKTGKTISILKIDNKKISTPFISNNELFIVRENSIIKFN